MQSLEFVAGAILTVFVLFDVFETVVLPRTVRRRFRVSRIIVFTSAMPIRATTLLPRSGGWRDSFLNIYGPLQLLFVLVAWVVLLILGFGLMYYALGTSAVEGSKALDGFGKSLYFSGTTFFTLGLGDLAPENTTSEVLTVIEAGTGFGMLALVIGYLPIYFQAFSRREIAISLLDARAGSPPTAYEFVRRNHGTISSQLLPQWEQWLAELLESHLSYPMLVFFRSQHERQSWLAALTMIMDTTALIMTGVEGVPPQQARFTYGMGRHTLVDLCQVFFLKPLPPANDRLPRATYREMTRRFADLGLRFEDELTAEARLAEIRKGYEPMANALARLLMMELPPWMPEPDAEDNWQTSPWDTVPGFGAGPGPR